ncbi:MAG: 50S ribosomal protein L24 [Candidatus Kapabacteria bacterium]|jgi:large subunit ribosomal protein L24|nr:50S ribosomal protein L24 [Candidatus Kapabacteria bacterium]
MKKLSIKKGDLVQVIAGNDKGKTGRVLDVYPEKMRILVDEVNVRKKHSRPTQANQQGGIVSKAMPIHYSNVQLVDSDGKPTRVGINIETKNDETIKTRVAKSNGAPVKQS